MTKQKILCLDIETSPSKGYFFGSIWETNIIEVIEHEQILTIAWKWYGDKSVKVRGQNDFKSYKPGVLNDKQLMEFFAPLLDSADIVVAHNGDRFDLTVLNSRLLAHGMKPVHYSKTFDTKKIAKNKFHLPSNKLDDIADFLNIERKISHSGKSMWFGCEKGNKKDWDNMKRYNKRDVVILEKIMTRILPFVKLTNQFHSDKICSNPTCNGTHLTKHSKRMLLKGWKQRYQCQDCGVLTTDNKLYAHKSKL